MLSASISAALGLFLPIFLVRTLLPVVIAVLLVVFGAKQILVNTLGTAFFFRLHLTIVPCVLMIPILVGIQNTGFLFFHIQLFPFCNFSFEFLFNGVVFIQYWIKMIHPTEIMIRYAQKADIKSDFHITGQLM